jgi:hypothetical protein
VSAEGASFIAEFKSGVPCLVKLKKDQDVREAAKHFNSYKEVEFAEPNYKMKMK